MSEARTSTRDVVFIALFAALTAALALFPPLQVPLLGVPVTAQSMGPMLAGAILGARRGALSMLLVVALVAIGLPILSGGRGGLGVFFGPTVGFLVGWLPAAYVTGLLHEKGWRSLSLVSSFAYCAIGGILVLYAVGIPLMILNTGLAPAKAFAATGVFVPGDLIKAAITAVVAVAVKRSYPLIDRPRARIG
ncbi:biotin transporter BioY [Consotaella salsifontis]|uniref:Biotin transporter n=1 Tax=Consotaella salsifontis TaxID=1365950 RepID=A0A1T4L375_9HYPH|nr:biotin transporter BioY [Consotaella salsifontis]SJZ49175.1 biotin transport system substrate-specific component [Consotaella salsifontis]